MKDKEMLWVRFDKAQKAKQKLEKQRIKAINEVNFTVLDEIDQKIKEIKQKGNELLDELNS